MRVSQANCPSCGADISFRPGTFVCVCAFCSSVVARNDEKLLLQGKVAALLETHSALELGLTGSYQGSGFALVGRTQLRHAAGGVWDEWYLAFDDGRWGWLAEAQGQFFLTFETRSIKTLPARGTVVPGQRYALTPGAPWTAREQGSARVETARGELPYAFSPGETYEYADFSGPRAAFASISWDGSSPSVFTGRQVSLPDLGFQAQERVWQATSTAVVSVSCPHCAGPLTLFAPEKTERVTCPSCDSLLDADKGALRFIRPLPKTEFRPAIPPGQEGTFRGQKFTAIGYMRRSCRVEGMTYTWREYLLYHPKVGFRWLMESDDHWSFVEPINVAEVEEGPKSCTWRDQSFKKFQEVEAVVDVVRGEFYWQVEQGERCMAADFVRAPLTLSREFSRGSGSQLGATELSWSACTYVEPEEVQSAFNLKNGLPSPSGIAPNQPSPWLDVLRGVLPLAMAFTLTLCFLWMYFSIGEKTVFKQTYQLNLEQQRAGAFVTFSEPFEIKNSGANLKVELAAPVNNSWFYTDGALVGEKTGEIQEFSFEAAYYHGVDGGESWSEGAQTATAYLSSMPSGSYVMRLATQFDPQHPVGDFGIKVEAGGTRPIYAFLAFLLVLAPPLIFGFLHGSFENRRWAESMYSGGDE